MNLIEVVAEYQPAVAAVSVAPDFHAMNDPTAPTHRDAPLRIAVIGYGLGGAAFHAPVIAATPGTCVAAIVTGDAERAADARARYPDADIVPTADRLWESTDRLDVAVVTTPNRTHVALARAALDAGLHVVVDKPIAPTAAEARALIEQARARGRVLTVYQNRRWDADFLTLRALLDDGALGEVFRFESRFERWRTEPKPGWRQKPDPQEAGGILYDLGPHLIDQALTLFGPVRDIYAELDRRRPGSAVDDDVFLALTHTNGVRSHLWMNVISASAAPRFRVLGARATWTKYGLDVQEAKLRAGEAIRAPSFGEEPEAAWGTLEHGDARRRTRSVAGDYRLFYARLIDAVRTGAAPPVDPNDALAALEIIAAARS